MSRRRTNSNSVSLFPFLAVLLCAMGALLFLLIVATRMIRDEAVQQTVVDSEPIHSDPPPRLLPELDDSPPIALADQDIVLGFAERVADPPQPKIPPLVAPKPIAIVHEPEPLPDQTAQIASLRRELEVIEESRREIERKQQQQKSLQTQRTAIEQELRARNQILSNAESAIAEMNRRGAEDAQQLAALNTRQTELEQTLRQLTERVRTSETKPRTGSNPLKIVPYEGAGGTTRRPLIIECRENSIVFQPEGVELTEQDLRGFTTTVNPVLSGVRALDRFWTVRDGAQGRSRRPYVLIVVRPDGIAAYYALRQLLSEYDQPFGYELLGDDQSLALETPDANASQLLNASVKELLARRDEFVASGNSSVAMGDSRTSNAPPERRPTSRESENFVSQPRGDTSRPRFRQTPRGLEIIPPDESSDENRFPKTPGSPRSFADSSLPRSLEPNNDVPRSSRSDETSKSSDRLEAQSLQPPDLLSPEARQGRPIESVQNPSSEIDIPQLLEPDLGDTNRSTARAPLLPTNPLLSGSGSAGASKGTSVSGPQVPALSDGKIRFQRELTVFLGPSEVRVGYGEPIPLEEGISTSELLTLIVKELRAEVATWGTPPDHLTWKPVVRFILRPGGLQHFERMKPYFERHQLVSSVGFELVEESVQENWNSLESFHEQEN